MKQILCVIVALLLALAAPALAEEVNLLTNGDFSLADAQGLPEGWQRGMWVTDAGVSTLYLDPNGYDGPCAAVVNADPNDARFEQTIAVEPDTLYRFSCMVRAEGCGDSGYGATLSFENTFSYSDSVLGTQGEWRKLEVYGRTGEEQTELTLMLRIGGYGMENSGKAWFDNVEAVRVDSAPETIEVLPLEENEPSSGGAAEVDGDIPAEPARNTEAYLLLCALYGVLMLAIARRMKRIGAARISGETLFTLGLAGALVLRLVLAGLVRGYNTDINCFSAWSERIYANGPAHFYAEDYFCDYPPGYMLLLWLPALLRNLLGLPVQGAVHLMLLKLMPIIFDIAGAVLVWKVALRNKLNVRLAAVLSMIYALNPAVLIDSAAWGQIDSIFTLLIAVCALKAAEEKYVPSLLAFAAAMLIKPQALLFAPLGLFAIVVNLVRRRSGKKVLEFVGGVAAALGLIYGLAFIFCLGRAQGPVDALLRPISWIVQLYGNTMGGYAYLTINALNLYNVLNFNWIGTAEQPIWTIVAWVLFGLSYVYAGLLVVKSRKREHLLLAGAALIALIFTFGPMIHERYIFPALLLLTLAYACQRDRRLLLCLVVMTMTTAMNELLVLQGGMGQGNYGHLQSSERWLNSLLSLVNVANALYLAWVALDICAGHHLCLSDCEAAEGETAASVELPKPKGHHMKLRRMDYLAMAVITLLYSVAAFTNLGTMDAPETSWTSSQRGESIVFDLGEVQTFHMTYYGGICNSNFTVELSNNGVAWTEPHYAQYRQGTIFRWLRYVPQNEDGENIYNQTWDPGNGAVYVTYASGENQYPTQTARYVRIAAESAGLILHEVGFLDESGKPLPVQIIDRSGALEGFETDPLLLIDEQHTVAAYPSYYNGTYFDEIYHARTAFEMNNGMSVYEWTHPPLGKALMGVGIQIFGMTPFGWRFMGALVGVLMVPLMYLLAKQLTKSSKLSFVAMCLMALDSMHFTQTRIATIDSYAVFWIMLMYLFMIRHIQMDWKQVSLGRSFVSLGLCGITMGVAIATKWIGAYAAVGLAVLLFWKWIAEILHAGEARKACLKRVGWSILFCIVFFVLVPVLIYYLSYTPQLKYEGVNSVFDMFSKDRAERVLGLQESMLDYHAGLGDDDHYYRSAWYQWPVIWWPMWYFSGTDFMPDGVISSISCMGNPAVWWSGLVALLFVLLGCAWKRRAPKPWLIALVGFASQFLPWVLVPRSTFIYHYFASVPFIILCTVLALDWLRKRNKIAFKWTAGILLAAALVLFVAFYPLESGYPVSRNYAQYLRWFKWYNF